MLTHRLDTGDTCRGRLREQAVNKGGSTGFDTPSFLGHGVFFFSAEINFYEIKKKEENENADL